MPRQKREAPHIKATMWLDKRLWYRFKTCCAALNTPPGQAIDSLLLAWLRANAPDALRQMEEE